MNPVILGIYRRQQQRAAQRASALRLDIAADTPYLNPQLYSAYLSGFVPGMPSSEEGLLLNSVPGFQISGGSESVPAAGGGPHHINIGPYAPALPPAYAVPGAPMSRISPVDHVMNLINMRRQALAAVNSIPVR